MYKFACNICNKNFADSLNSKRLYCSRKCACIGNLLQWRRNKPEEFSKVQKLLAFRISKKTHSEAGKLGGLAVVRLHCANKTGMWSRNSIDKMVNTDRKRKIGFFNEKARKKNLQEIKRNKIGCCYNEKLRAEMTSRSAKKNYAPRIIVHCKVCNKKMSITPDLAQSIKYCSHSCAGKSRPRSHFVYMSKIGRHKAMKSLRDIKHKKYWNVSFDSMHEIQICKKLKLRPINGKNVHVRVNSREFDFKIGNVFVEYHPWDYDGKTYEQYYTERRKILDENGFKKNPLLILKSQQEINSIRLEDTIRKVLK